MYDHLTTKQLNQRHNTLAAMALKLKPTQERRVILHKFLFPMCSELRKRELANAK